MSAREPKQFIVVTTRMVSNERQLRVGIALLVAAGALLFVPTALGAFTQASAAVAVLGLAGGAVLVGTAGDERPV
ncbi:hypothetical protein [Halorussus lipolyticus]|uniref:hypothetical protein n=1 Tax=Halorussus lipolyticus TaxID=3034024 RepID=UPI0023E77529|nr:hypothetical protein [Halorussus sp. DT80]